MDVEAFQQYKLHTESLNTLLTKFVHLNDPWNRLCQEYAFNENETTFSVETLLKSSYSETLLNQAVITNASAYDLLRSYVYLFPVGVRVVWTEV